MTSPTPHSTATSSGSSEIWTYDPPRSGRLVRGLWWCAGADAQILVRCTFAEHVKFASIGGFVLATGLLATLTMWFAMLTVFKSIAVASVIAPAWGVMIFNIDRFIVSSTGKGDGEETISKTEFRNALPRLVMALAISFAVSAPLETKIFERELDQWIAEDNSNIRNAERQKYQSVYANEESLRNARISALQTQIREQDSAILEQNKYLVKEQFGQNPNSPLTGCGGNCKKLLSADSSLKKRLSALNDELQEALQEQKDRQTEVDNVMSASASTLQNRDGLLARVILAHERAPWSCALITFVLVCIEWAPIVFKLMLVKGPYDYIEESVRDLIRAQEGVEVSHRWQAMAGVPEGGRLVTDPPIHHRARIEVARRRKATNTQLAVEAAAWRAYRARLVADATARPEQYFEEPPRPAQPPLDGATDASRPTSDPAPVDV